MRKSIAIIFLLIVAVAERAEAANFAVITNPPTILNLLIFVFSIICIVFGYQVLSLVKGGFLSKGWRLLVGGFALMAAGQMIYLLEAFEVAVLPELIAPAIMVASVGLFFFGLFETKKVLG